MPSTNDEIHKAIGQLQGTVESLNTHVKERLDRDTDRLDKHDKDIGGLKQSRAKMWGAGAVLAALASSLGLDELWNLIK